MNNEILVMSKTDVEEMIECGMLSGYTASARAATLPFLLLSNRNISTVNYMDMSKPENIMKLRTSTLWESIRHQHLKEWYEKPEAIGKLYMMYDHKDALGYGILKAYHKDAKYPFEDDNHDRWKHIKKIDNELTNYKV